MVNELVPRPVRGRTFTAERRVRWSDVDADRRLRFDGIARYLQDVASDDLRDVGHDPNEPWVVRWTTIVVEEPIVVGEMVTATTWASGTGSRVAERRTSLEGDQGGRVETVALWVLIDAATGRPARLRADVEGVWGEATGGRSVGSRLSHGPPPPDASERPWVVRASDIDGLGHVNNAATWLAVVDEATRSGLAGRTATVEYPGALELADDARLRSVVEPDGSLALWLTVDGAVRASAVVTP